MADSTPPSTPEEAVAYYLDVLAASLEACADWRADRDATFLWHARRCIEAILYALAQGTELARRIEGQDKSRDPVDHHRLALDLWRQDRLDRSIRDAINLVRSTGNLGAHIRSPTARLGGFDISLATDNLVHIVAWLFQESVHRRPMPAPIEKALRSLSAAEAPPSPIDRLEKALEREQQLRATAERELEALQERLNSQDLTLVDLALPVASAEVPVLPSSRPRERLPIVVALLVCVGGGGLLGWSLVRRADDPPAASAAPVGSVAMAAAAPTPVPSVVDVAPTAPQDASARSAPPPPTCPSGTLRVGASTLRFTRGPYPRRSWGAAGPIADPIDVPAFCIDAAPIDADAYGRCVDAGDCDAAVDGCASGTCRDGPACCVPWAGAQAYCAQQGGALPTIAQWEAVWRAAADRLERADGQQEWSADVFPPRIFGYEGAPGASPRHLFADEVLDEDRDDHPVLSWNREPRRGAHFQKLGFRCAYPVAPPD
ncbi:MAG: SUMF1/EgtB/PvdO family nonheme iron enzyme [Myxococcales bacterium]|nr:SUMF1/EgtB/PvdO family nonheme iron enzyme [Myxococcales bacterium]MCB9537231.1 SUMF1/EgtB/PvdO family nonheme iron enzyme [Myxococcales bacterium]